MVVVVVVVVVCGPSLVFSFGPKLNNISNNNVVSFIPKNDFCSQLSSLSNFQIIFK